MSVYKKSDPFTLGSYEFADEYDGEEVNHDLPEVNLQEAVGQLSPHPEVGRVKVAYQIDPNQIKKRLLQ